MPNKAKQSVVSKLFKDAMDEPCERGKILLEDLEALQVDGRYDQGMDLSSGGMKKIFIHSDQMMQRQIAMAVPRKDKQDYESLWNFIREARITAKVAHPNIVPVHEIGVNDDGMPYYTMKYIQGENLGEVLRKLADKNEVYQKNYSLNKLLTIYIKVCEAIAFAHSKGVIHLDLKPENILVSTYGQVQVCDWGLAHELDHLDETLEAKLTGSPGYLSPEQIRGESIGLESDLYALGALLYHVLGLVRPFDGVALDEILKCTLIGAVPEIQVMSTVKVPKVLQAIVKKAMHVDLSQRYSSVNELITDIEAYKNSFPTKAAQPAYWGRFILLSKRHKTTSMLMLLGLMLLSIISSIYSVKMQEEVYKRKEIAKKSVGHYNELAIQKLEEYNFSEAQKAVSLALSYQDNQESHWIQAQVYVALRKFDRARYHAKLGHQRLYSVLNKFADHPHPQGDDFLILLISDLMRNHFPGIVRTLLWKRNAEYQDLSTHLFFVERTLRALNPSLVKYKLTLEQGKIHFTGAEGFSRLSPFINLPVERLDLRNSYVYELKALHEMKTLSYLDLKNAQVFQVPELIGMNLDYLDLSNTTLYSFDDLSKVNVKHLVFKNAKALHLGKLTENNNLEKLEIAIDRYHRPYDKKHIRTLRKRGVIQD